MKKWRPNYSINDFTKIKNKKTIINFSDRAPVKKQMKQRTERATKAKYKKKEINFRTYRAVVLQLRLEMDVGVSENPLAC